MHSRHPPDNRLDAAATKQQQQQQQQQQHSGLAACASDSSSSSAAPLEAVVSVEGCCLGGSRSIYDRFSRRKQYLVLGSVSAAGILIPLCTSMYLPALVPIMLDLNTSLALVAATLSVFLFALGLASLVVGPASDRYGRRILLLSSTALFIVAALAIAFSNHVAVLVAFRALEGATLAVYGSTGTAIAADVFRPSERGTALGIVSLPILIGPLVGPLIGGQLVQAFGWRSIFYTKAAFAGLAIAVLWFLPETNQFVYLTRLRASNPAAAAEVREADAILRRPPKFQPPWFPLRLLLGRAELLPVASCLAIFSASLCTQAQLPISLASPPYNLAPSLVGVGMLPIGIGGIIAAPLGGWVADRCAVARPAVPSHRLAANCVLNSTLLPAALLLFGWGFQLRLPLAAGLSALFFVTLCNGMFLPAMFSFLVSLQQQAAGAAAAGLYAMMFITSGVAIQVATAVMAAIGQGALFSMLAALNMLLAAATLWQTHSSVRKAERAAAATAGDAAAPAGAGPGTGITGVGSSRAAAGRPPVGSAASLTALLRSFTGKNSSSRAAAADEAA